MSRIYGVPRPWLLVAREGDVSSPVWTILETGDDGVKNILHLFRFPEVNNFPLIPAYLQKSEFYLFKNFISSSLVKTFLPPKQSSAFRLPIPTFMYILFLRVPTDPIMLPMMLAEKWVDMYMQKIAAKKVLLLFGWHAIFISILAPQCSQFP